MTSSKIKYMHKKEIDLIFNSLILSIIVLNTISLPTQKNIKFEEYSIDLRKVFFFYSSFLELEVLFYGWEIKKILIELITLINNNRLLTNQISQGENYKLKQYLRKFSFLYKKLVLTNYPNDLSTIKQQKVNMLAIKNLYILDSL